MDQDIETVRAARRRAEHLFVLDRVARVFAAVIGVFAISYYLFVYNEYPSTSQTIFFASVTALAVIFYAFANALRQRAYWLELQIAKALETHKSENSEWVNIIARNMHSSIIKILFDGAIRDFPGVLYLPRRIDETTSSTSHPKIYEDFWHYLYLAVAAFVIYVAFLLMWGVAAFPIIALHYFDVISDDSSQMLLLALLVVAHIIFVWSAVKILPKLYRERRGTAAIRGD